MACDPKCAFTASLDEKGRRQMISQPGNKKFPISSTLHPRCDECAKEEFEHGKLMILFNNNFALVDQYEKLKGS